jgi:hypothetical protein
MAKKTNTLTPHVQALHRALALSNFAASSSEASTKREKQRVQAVIDGGNKAALITMAALIGCDTYEPDPKKTTAVAYGGQLIKGEETLLLLDESNASAQANALVDAHEAMEVFVKAITAQFMYAFRGQIPVYQEDRRMMQRRFGKQAAAENTPQYFEQLVHVLAWRNCAPLFDILFKRIDGLSERVTKGHFGSYHEIHKAVEFVRHCKTHGNGRFNRDDLKKQPKHTIAIVESCIEKSVIHGDERILPSHKAAHDLLASEADYGQILYDAMSNGMDMELDYKPS